MTLSVLIYCSKAFDTIDNRILLEKLQKMNFAKNTIKTICFKNINVRTQFNGKQNCQKQVHFCGEQ